MKQSAGELWRAPAELRTWKNLEKMLQMPDAKCCWTHMPLPPGAKPGNLASKGGRARWLPQPVFKQAEPLFFKSHNTDAFMNESHQFLRILSWTTFILKILWTQHFREDWRQEYGSKTQKWSRTFKKAYVAWTGSQDPWEAENNDRFYLYPGNEKEIQRKISPPKSMLKSGLSSVIFMASCPNSLLHVVY